MLVRIASAALIAIRRHAQAADPHECCGLLLGLPDEIQTAVPASNRAADPTRRYEIDPQEHFAAIRTARGRGVEVVGAYHSHPRSAPLPSVTDRAEAFDDFVFVIAGRPEAAADRLTFAVRAWRLSSGNFVELPLVCEA